MAKKIIIDSELLEAINNELKECINEKEDAKNKIHLIQDMDNIAEQYPSIEYLQKYYRDNEGINNLLNNVIENLVKKDDVYNKAEINELLKNFESTRTISDAIYAVENYGDISTSNIECGAVENYGDISTSNIEHGTVEQNNNVSTVLIKEEVNMDE